MVTPHFIGELILKALPDGRRWELRETFGFQSALTELVLRAPINFICDFASIPRLFWRLIGPPATGKYRRAAIIHDYLYRFGHLLGISRKQADAIFREAMRCDGVGRIKAGLIYQAVRLAGWAAYKYGEMA